MRILAVDDDPIILDLLSGALEAFGYSDLTLAGCGEEALESIAATQILFDCFLFDIQMPGMDGIELCRSVRELPQYSGSPILMITAMNKKDYVDRAFLAGATDYVTKPFDVTELKTRIALADRLQFEMKRVDEAARKAGQPQHITFDEAIKPLKNEGFVTPMVLENYVGQMLSSRNSIPQVIAIKIPELETVFDGSSVEEYAYVIADVSEVIVDMMSGHQVFTSYFGSGIFVCVGPEHEMLERRQLKIGLATCLNNPEFVYCEDVETSFSPILGTYYTPGPMQKIGPRELFGMAIDKVANKTSDSKFSVAKTLFGKLDLKRSA